MTKRRLISILFTLAALLLLPMVIVMPTFQHGCSGDLGQYASESCSMENSHDMAVGTCCCQDSDDDCSDCAPVVKDYTFIDQTLVSNFDKWQLTPVVMDLPFFTQHILEESLLFGMAQRIIFLPPQSPLGNAMQSFLCVFIC